jgi:nicotinamide-nucleotide amidase
VAQDPDPTAEGIGDVLARDGATLAVAESLTGGELSARFAAARGSGDWYRGGVVAYSSTVKRRLLDVPAGPVVSQPAVAAMADGVVRLLDADIGLAVTGVAGPSSQDGCEPGTVWLAVRDAQGTHTRLERFDGSPQDVVDQTARRAIEWLAARLGAGGG